MRTALVTNCAPDVPVLWPSTVFADLFDVTIFSCQVGYMKPEKEISSWRSTQSVFPPRGPGSSVTAVTMS